EDRRSVCEHLGQHGSAAELVDQQACVVGRPVAAAALAGDSGDVLLAVDLVAHCATDRARLDIAAPHFFTTVGAEGLERVAGGLEHQVAPGGQHACAGAGDALLPHGPALHGVPGHQIGAGTLQLRRGCVRALVDV